MSRSISSSFILLLFSLVLIGCTPGSSAISPPLDISSHIDDIEPVSTPTPAALSKISAEQAKEIMDTADEFIILDVRTEEEYQEGHIEGAILIPDYDLASKAEELLSNKSTTLLIYCRSGRRSALAANTLIGLGYTSLYDFGGILDWPYEVVTNQ